MGFLQLLKTDYELWLKNPKKYKKRVNDLSKLFNFKNEYKFKANLPPSGFTGRYTKKNQFVMFGLNPGYNREFSQREELKQMGTWAKYVEIRKNMYSFFKELDHPSQYYQKFWLLFSNLIKDTKKYQTKWDFYDQNVTNLNIFPFHSGKFKLSKRRIKQKPEFFKERLDSLVRFITNYKPRLFLFNGKPWESILINNSIIEKYDRVHVNDDFSLYFFRYNKIPSVLFEKFFSRHFWLDDVEREKTIPKLIRNQYPNQFSY